MGENYYHVTSFLGRPGQPFRRVYGRIDNALRNVVAKTLKTSRKNWAEDKLLIYSF